MSSPSTHRATISVSHQNTWKLSQFPKISTLQEYNQLGICQRSPIKWAVQGQQSKIHPLFLKRKDQEWESAMWCPATLKWSLCWWRGDRGSCWLSVLRTRQRQRCQKKKNCYKIPCRGTSSLLIEVEPAYGGFRWGCTAPPPLCLYIQLSLDPRQGHQPTQSSRRRSGAGTLWASNWFTPQGCTLWTCKR